MLVVHYDISGELVVHCDVRGASHGINEKLFRDNWVHLSKPTFYIDNTVRIKRIVLRVMRFELYDVTLVVHLEAKTLNFEN